MAATSPITDYASLIEQLQVWANMGISDHDEIMVQMAEKQISRDLRVSAMKTDLSEPISGGVVAVPSGFLEFSWAAISGSPTYPLQIQTEDWIHATYPTRSASGVPRHLSVGGVNFEFGPYPDSDYTLIGSYYKELDPLNSTTNTSNWLTTNAPDVLLAACLYNLFLFNDDTRNSDKWGAIYLRKVEDVMKAEQQRTHPRNVPLTARVRY